MTDTKKIELSQTCDALAELSESLLQLSGMIEDKKIELTDAKKKSDNESKNNSKSLEILKNSSQSIIGDIDTIISQLDKILEKDGTSNNNN